MTAITHAGIFGGMELGSYIPINEIMCEIGLDLGTPNCGYGPVELKPVSNEQMRALFTRTKQELTHWVNKLTEIEKKYQ